jgi:hypothetical protein
MDNQLAQVCCPERSSNKRLTLLVDLRCDVAALRDRVDHLERENLELRQQAGDWKSCHRDAMRRAGELKQQGGMDTHRKTNDSGWTDQSSIPNSFSTKWFEAQINVWARRIDLSLRRISELGSHWAPAPVAVAAASLLEERGGPVRGCDACPVTSGFINFVVHRPEGRAVPSKGVRATISSLRTEVLPSKDC